LTRIRPVRDAKLVVTGERQINAHIASIAAARTERESSRIDRPSPAHRVADPRRHLPRARRRRPSLLRESGGCV
jgi:hypothetical protein